MTINSREEQMAAANLKHISTHIPQPWPALPYEDFKETSHLLFSALQMFGKYKLYTPFQPQWANVVLPITCRGITTGSIPYEGGAFSLDYDCLEHRIQIQTTWGDRTEFPIHSMSVAQLYRKILNNIASLEIHLKINPRPQEIPNPINFNDDKKIIDYKPFLVTAWWQILVSIHVVMERFHGKFKGKTPPIGLMWGTSDIRDVYYSGKKIPIDPNGPNKGYIRRNSMNEEMIESGWWSGNDMYPKPAFYSFTHPQPPGIEKAKIKPKEAHWDDTLKLFILDYDVVRTADSPEDTLYQFLESNYAVGSQLAGWNRHFLGEGQPE
jgi:hypothetical protein